MILPICRPDFPPREGNDDWRETAHARSRLSVGGRSRALSARGHLRQRNAGPGLRPYRAHLPRPGRHFRAGHRRDLSRTGRDDGSGRGRAARARPGAARPGRVPAREQQGARDLLRRLPQGAAHSHLHARRAPQARDRLSRGACEGAGAHRGPRRPEVRLRRVRAQHAERGAEPPPHRRRQGRTSG